MEIDTDRLFESAIRDAIRDGIKAKMTGYNTDLDKLVSAAIAANAEKFRTLLETAIASAIDDAEFRREITAAVNHSLAKTLVQRFGGEIEKQVNVLKSDPTTRARITLAIEDIVRNANKA
jgi:hypothetical protein